MKDIAQKIKDKAIELGVDLVGIAGPDRLDGPVSLDPTFVLRDAKSVVSLAIAMNVDAIYDFLGKKSPAPHNIDQIKSGQRMQRIAKELESHMCDTLGIRSKMVPNNNTYRRTPDIFNLHPNFSHRYGAVAAGLGGFGLSGNVMTEQFGASVYLASVLTTAELPSDPAYSPRHFMDNYCKTCKLCDKTCPVQMFFVDEQEYTLINGELHPRGKRKDVQLCGNACFGMHGISQCKTWSSYGRHWTWKWVDEEPDYTNRGLIIKDSSERMAWTGDSAARYDAIRRFYSKVYPGLEKMLPAYADLPESEEDRLKLAREAMEVMGLKNMKDPYTLTCGQCSLVCGPNFEETTKRFQILMDAGIVVPGPNGEWLRMKDFNEAAEYKKKHPVQITKSDANKDTLALGWLFMRLYYGFNPISEYKAWKYDQKLKKAVADAGLPGRDAKKPKTEPLGLFKYSAPVKPPAEEADAYK